MDEDDFRLLGDVVAGVAQQVDRLVQAARGDEDEVAIERRGNPDRQLAGCQRRHDGAQHPGRLGIVRLVTSPQSDFALPGGRYPVEDKTHARDAKARASQSYNAGKLSASDRAKVDKKADAVLSKKGK